jgi:hypothetical protein
VNRPKLVLSARQQVVVAPLPRVNIKFPRVNDSARASVIASARQHHFPARQFLNPNHQLNKYVRAL